MPRIWSSRHFVYDILVSTPLIFYMSTPRIMELALSFSNQNISSVNSSESERKPVVYSSSSLTPTEQNFVQTEKETLAILHALHKLDHMFFRKADIIWHTDHKPFGGDLQWYSFRVEYCRGSTRAPPCSYDISSTFTNASKKTSW